MTLDTPTLTPIGRLDNPADRITSSRGRLDSMTGRGHLNADLGGDLQGVRRLLDWLARTLNETIGGSTSSPGAGTRSARRPNASSTS